MGDPFGGSSFSVSAMVVKLVENATESYSKSSDSPDGHVIVDG